MKKFFAKLLAAVILSSVIVTVGFYVIGKYFKNSPIDTPKRSIGNEVPPAVFASENGDRFDLKEAFGQVKRTWVVPVFYKCPGACTLVIERVLEQVSESEALKSKLGSEFQIIFFSFDATESFELAEAKRQFAFRRKSIDSVQAQNAIRFLSGGGSSAEIVTRALRFEYKWDDKVEIYNHDLKYFEVNDRGVVTDEFSLDGNHSAMTVAEKK